MRTEEVCGTGAKHIYIKLLICKEIGAGNEIRTRGLNLGKVALYQLSYTRALTLKFSANLITLASLLWRPLGESNPCCLDENQVS